MRKRKSGSKVRSKGERVDGARKNFRRAAGKPNMTKKTITFEGDKTGRGGGHEERGAVSKVQY